MTGISAIVLAEASPPDQCGHKFLTVEKYNRHRLQDIQTVKYMKGLSRP